MACAAAEAGGYYLRTGIGFDRPVEMVFSDKGVFKRVSRGAVWLRHGSRRGTVPFDRQRWHGGRGRSRRRSQCHAAAAPGGPDRVPAAPPLPWTRELPRPGDAAIGCGGHLDLVGDAHGLCGPARIRRTHARYRRTLPRSGCRRGAHADRRYNHDVPGERRRPCLAASGPNAAWMVTAGVAAALTRRTTLELALALHRQRRGPHGPGPGNGRVARPKPRAAATRPRRNAGAGRRSRPRGVGTRRILKWKAYRGHDGAGSFARTLSRGEHGTKRLAPPWRSEGLFGTIDRLTDQTETSSCATGGIHGGTADWPGGRSNESASGHGVQVCC